MTNNLVSRVAWLLEDTCSQIETKEVNNACRVYPYCGHYVIIVYGVTMSGQWFTRTWFDDSDVQPICVYPSGHDVKQYVKHMLDID